MSNVERAPSPLRRRDRTKGSRRSTQQVLLCSFEIPRFAKYIAACCDVTPLCVQAKEALTESTSYANLHEQYKNDANRLARLAAAGSRVMSNQAYWWGVITGVRGAVPAGSILKDLKYGSVVADVEFARQAGLDIWNNAYGLIGATNAFDVFNGTVGTVSTAADITARVAETTFGGSRALAFSSAVGRYNPYVAAISGAFSVLSINEKYEGQRQEYQSYEKFQQDTLDALQSKSESYGKTADNLLALWKAKGCDSL